MHVFFLKLNEYTEVHEQLDYIFITFDNYFFIEDFKNINDILEAWDIENSATPLLIAALTASLGFREKLEYRPEFYKKIKDKIGEDLIIGLNMKKEEFDFELVSFGEEVIKLPIYSQGEVDELLDSQNTQNNV